MKSLVYLSNKIYWPMSQIGITVMRFPLKNLKCKLTTIALLHVMIIFIFRINFLLYSKFLIQVILFIYYFLSLMHRFYCFYLLSSCPVGTRRLGSTRCIDQDECEDPTLCANGASCINLSDSRRFRCLCSPGWTGRYCDEGAAVLLGGKDFIIVFVFCIASLLSKYFCSHKLL